MAQLAITGHDYRGVVDLNGDTDETILQLSHLIPRFIERYMTPCTALRHGNIMLFRFADSIHMGTYFAGGKILHVMPGYTSRLNAYGRYFKEREIGLYRGR